MVHQIPIFRLPLMHHFMEHCVRDLAPGVSGEVPPADTDLLITVVVVVYRPFAQASFHPAGKPDGNRTQHPAEMADIEVPVHGLQPLEQDIVTGMGAVSPRGPLGGPAVGPDREPEKFAFSFPPQVPGHTRAEEPDNRLQHSVGSESVALMDPQYSAIQA